MDLLKIRTQQFEGPLDLLLFLIQKNELDISAISLHQITDQYVQYVNLMRELDFDLASEFLVMAAALIYLKSKRLLPADEEATASNQDSDLPQSEEEILRRLREYKKFQEAGNRLLTLPRLDEDVFTRPNVAPPEKQTIWKEMDVTGLALAMQDALYRSRRRTRVIIRDSISLPERIAKLSQVLKVDETTEFASLLTADPNCEEIVGTLLAVLELSRLKKVRVYQNEAFSTIYVTLYEAFDELDPKLMTGFQYKAHGTVVNNAVATA